MTKLNYGDIFVLHPNETVWTVANTFEENEEGVLAYAIDDEGGGISIDEDLLDRIDVICNHGNMHFYRRYYTYHDIQEILIAAQAVGIDAYDFEESSALINCYMSKGRDSWQGLKSNVPAYLHGFQYEDNGINVDFDDKVEQISNKNFRTLLKKDVLQNVKYCPCEDDE